MAISREEVVWAYRVILGRDPESEQVVARYMDSGSLRALRDIVVISDECRASLPVAFVGQHQEVEAFDIQTRCSPEEMSAMLGNIAREWRRFGEVDPHWSVVTHDDFRAARIAENLDAFYRTGADHLRTMLNPLGRSGTAPTRFGKVLDFGCGVGRLTLALAGVAESVTGVDISNAHLDLARERAATTGVANADFVAIDRIEDLDRFGGFDLIVSFVVLQHNPPPVMAEILARLLKALRPGGSAIIQMPTYIVGQRFSVRDYLANRQPAMEMNGLPQHVVFEIADAADCRILEVRQDNFMGADIGLSHTFALQRRDAAPAAH